MNPRRTWCIALAILSGSHMGCAGSLAVQEGDVEAARDARAAPPARTRGAIVRSHGFTLPVAFWRFEEGLSNTAGDLSGHGNTGTLVGAAWSSDAPPVATDRYALAFDGIGYVSVTPSPSLTLASSLTLAAWIKPTDPTAGGTGATLGVLTQARPSGGGGYRLGVEGGSANFGMNNDRWNCSLSSATKLVAKRWTHVAATYNGATMKIYVDGALDGMSACAHRDLLPNRTPTFIGRELDVPGWQLFEGLIDEVLVYDTALDDEDVRTIFDGHR